MNLWKPTAIVSTAALALTLGYQTARANPPPAEPPTVAGNQPNMEAALASLRRARGSLEHAEHDKGGWRAIALQHTDEAIKETVRGIEYADKK